MKRIFTVALLTVVLLATSIFAQSPTAFRQVSRVSIVRYNPPNFWYGSVLSAPLGENFDLAYELQAKTVIDFTQFKLGRTWNVLAFGNLGLPNYNNLNAFTAVASSQTGIDVGIQTFSTFGKLSDKAFTVYLTGKAKLNSFGGTDINSYHAGAGLELSLRGGGLPLIVNVSPTYVLLASKGKFASVQSETNAAGFWMTDTFVIVPVGDKLGLLVQSTFAENASPVVRAGLILAAGL
jgi:hypothetical protein